MNYPNARYSEEPVTTYPLTKDELRFLAAHWAYEHLECNVICRRYGAVGPRNLRIWEYTENRLNKIAGILGPNEIEEVLAEVDVKMHQHIGDKMWTAFCDGRAIFGHDALAENQGQIKIVGNY
jgi:hypothetical protein